MKIFFKPQIPDWRMIPLDVESTQLHRPGQMNRTTFQIRLKQLQRSTNNWSNAAIAAENGNGIFDRHEFPVLTAEHTRCPGVMI